MCQTTSKPAAAAALITAEVGGDPDTSLSNSNWGLEVEFVHFKEL